MQSALGRAVLHDDHVTFSRRFDGVPNLKWHAPCCPRMRIKTRAEYSLDAVCRQSKGSSRKFKSRTFQEEQFPKPRWLHQKTIPINWEKKHTPRM
jgi:hypothetical protein